MGELNAERYDKAIKEKLLAGLKDESAVIATKEAAMLETACPLQITTRQVGFGLSKMLNTTNATQKAETLVQANRGTINQYYRIGLGLAEAKLYRTKIRVNEAVDEV